MVTEIKSGLKFSNVHMPGAITEVTEVRPDANELDVYIQQGTRRFVDRNWNLEHTKWAFERGEYNAIEKEYPIAGYAPGNYQNKCRSCGVMFVGDKMAVQCEPCAEITHAQFLASQTIGAASSEEQQVLNEAFKKSLKPTSRREYLKHLGYTHSTPPTKGNPEYITANACLQQHYPDYNNLSEEQVESLINCMLFYGRQLDSQPTEVKTAEEVPPEQFLANAIGWEKWTHTMLHREKEALVNACKKYASQFKQQHQLPADVKEAIKVEAEKQFSPDMDSIYPVYLKYRIVFKQGAEYASHLYQSKITELEKELNHAWGLVKVQNGILASKEQLQAKLKEILDGEVSDTTGGEQGGTAG